MNDAGNRLKVIAGSGFTEGFNAADHKLVLLRRLMIFFLSFLYNNL